jgi:hypothetical protein
MLPMVEQALLISKQGPKISQSVEQALLICK